MKTIYIYWFSNPIGTITKTDEGKYDIKIYDGFIKWARHINEPLICESGVYDKLPGSIRRRIPVVKSYMGKELVKKMKQEGYINIDDLDLLEYSKGVSISDDYIFLKYLTIEEDYYGIMYEYELQRRKGVTPDEM